MTGNREVTVDDLPDAPNPTREKTEVDETAEVIAVGAPKDRDDATIEGECPACVEVTDRAYEVETDGDTTTYVPQCAQCGAETDRFE